MRAMITATIAATMVFPGCFFGGEEAGVEPICEPQEKKCDGSDIVKCNSDGSDWAFYKECPHGCKKGKCIEPTESCKPTCNGRNCGDDGCGGSCGKCGAGETCNHGACCMPTCITLEGGIGECGDDGCGGSCGKCGAGKACFGGHCCTKQCFTMEGAIAQCGSDGCGGQCGTCSSGESCVNMTCVQSGAGCKPKCTGKECGSDGCGGTCGLCSASEACNWSIGVCAPTSAGVVEGWLRYEVRTPTVDFWGAVVLDDVQEGDGAGLLALVADSEGNVVGASQVDTEGYFAVPVSGEPAGDEQLLFAAMWAPSLEADEPLLVVAYPDSGGGTAGSMIPSTPWAWLFEVPPGGYVGNILVTEAQGSGAMFLFVVTLAAMQTVAYDLAGGVADKVVPLAVLWKPGVAWEDCGACFVGSGGAQNIADAYFPQSVFIGGEADGASAWGYPVTLHEFGHYVAHNYSKDDSPGGDHTIGQPLAPPFAWSEGWASFFSVLTVSRWLGQAVTLFWDIQGGSSFWLDYAEGDCSGDGLFSDVISPASPLAGMYQELDENWVTTMLFNLWDGGEVPEVGANDGIALETATVMAAVSSERILCGDRGAKGVDFVDFLDAVACQYGFITDDLAYAVKEYFGFPYDGNKSCKTCN